VKVVTGLREAGEAVVGPQDQDTQPWGLVGEKIKKKKNQEGHKKPSKRKKHEISTRSFKPPATD